MKVNDPNLAGAGQGRLGGAELERSSQLDALVRPGGLRRAGVGGAPTDQVSLSALSARLQSLHSDPPGQAARLEKLSGEVAAGRYRVDAMELSRRLVEASLRPKE